MELLGSYSSSLTQFHYQELLALLNVSIAAGDLSGGSAFDSSSLLALEQQGQNFSSLPSPSAGTTVTDDTFNNPLSLLQARFKAIAAEANDFITVSGVLLSILESETALIDHLLAANTLQQWVNSNLQVLGSWSTAWDFNTSQGRKSLTIDPVDPANNVNYPSYPITGLLFDTTTGVAHGGLQPAATVRSLAIKNLIWTYSSTGTPEALYAPDMSWAELNLLEDLPQVIYATTPSVEVIYPVGGLSAGMFQVSGPVPGGTLPTYLRVLFYPRRNQITASITNGVATTLTPYTIDPDNVEIWTADAVFNKDTDFTTDPNGSVTPIDIGTNVEVTIRFTENFPAYQCSMDQLHWSPIYMLDLTRPYPDDATTFLPLNIVNGMFPLMDETGMPTGLYFQLLAPLNSNYTLLVTTPAAVGYGPQATLELDIEKPTYCNTVSVSPFAAFPATLTKVEVEGMISSARTTVWSGSYLMEESTQIRFPRQLISKVYLTFVQENYTIKEYHQSSPDALRRATMDNLQSILPFSVRRPPSPNPTIYRGYQYEFGFEEMVVQDVAPTLPCIYVQGPMVLSGCPNAIYLEAETIGDVQIYLCYRVYDSSGTLLDYNITGILTTPSVGYVFPVNSAVDRSTIVSTELSLKFALRDAASVVSRYNLQATVR